MGVVNATDVINGEDKPTIEAITAAKHYTKTEQDAIDDAQDANVSGLSNRNLLINGRGLIQQRGVTGGTKQVILNTMNGGGTHTISWVGTATVTIKEATTLGASDALTTWDTALLTAGVSGNTVTLTVGKYVHVEFSSTVWDFAQLELGSVATNFEYRHNELDLCLPFYERFNFLTTVEIALVNWFSTNSGISDSVTIRNKRVIPIVRISNFSHFEGRNSTSGALTLSVMIGTASGLNFITFSLTLSGTTTAGIVGRVRAINASAWVDANSEIFNADDGVGINYKEDRWYV